VTAPAFLALWNDLAPGHEAAYADWHTREHVPERVACPGFRAGRRYVNAAHPAHRWFTLYDLDAPDALETAAYRDLLANPTPASAAMRPLFRDALRVVCTQVAEAGFGMGGTLAVLRLPEQPIPLVELAQEPGVVRARLGRRIDAGEGARLGSGGFAPAPFDLVLLLDTTARAAADHALAAAASRFGAAEPGGAYDLAFVFPGADPAERIAHRRPGWPTPPA
jgi:hypothetical protein